MRTRLRRSLLEARWALFARHLAASKKPILLGPFRSEVGFELLYWIPFLCHFRETYQIPADRLITLSRGGAASWYKTAGHADLYEFLPVDAVRTLSIKASQQTGSVKQRHSEAWERHVCALAAKTVGIERYHVLSPRWMYQLLAPWWEGDVSSKFLDRYTLQPMKMHAPPLEAGIKLPKSFIAMRWYARATWPLKEDLTLWTRKLTEAVASRIPVVLIDSGYQADDHADIELGHIPNVSKLSDLAPHMTPLNNLAIQSSVIANASAYVGTYGGMAQGAMRWGIPTVALYHEFANTAPQHLALTHQLSLRTGVPFYAGTPQYIDALIPLIEQQLETGAVYA